jgi:hypothetical protein
MTIHRSDKEHVFSFTCDGDRCPSVFEATAHAGFKGSWEEAKIEGWTAIKQGDAWSHMCPDCKS